MTKKEAIKIFGSTQRDLAEAVGRSHQCVKQWPNVLDIDRVRTVLGAAILLGKDIPKDAIQDL